MVAAGFSLRTLKGATLKIQCDTAFIEHLRIKHQNYVRLGDTLNFFFESFLKHRR